MATHEPPRSGESEKLRAFVALSLEPAARKALTRAGKDLQREAWAEEVRWVRPESLHLTLRFLGEIPTTGVSGLLEALTARMREVEPFACALSGLALFPSASRPRVVAAQVTQERLLTDLAAAVEEAVVDAGYPADARAFRAHVTLGRFRRGKRRGLEIAATLQQVPVAVAVNDIVLFRSVLGPGGARYSELGRVALAERPST
ncbi:MAG: RNA 2',3'-cyclic phosphodiesterase [Deltaproteobacteria bacterium]|nr:RNA 2',3'-cyclic phosphodiesterase [Deltaproteobacteria bacterium]